MTDTQTRCERCGTDMPPTVTAFLHEGAVVCRACHDELAPACPTCHKALEAMPESTTACPHCGWPIHVVREQDVFDSTLLSKAQLEELADLRKKLGVLRRFGLTEGQYLRTRAQLKTQTGDEPDDVTIMRRLFYLAAQACDTPADRAAVGYAEARYLHSQGLDYFHVLKRAHQQQLEAYEAEGIDGVTVAGPTDTCAYCRKRAGTPLVLRREQQDPELPYPDCPNKSVASTVAIDGEVMKVGVNKDAFCEAKYEPYAK